MIFLATVVIVLLTTSVHCQLQTTYLNATSSFVSLQRWDMEPEGAMSFRIRTFQLNAILLYMQSDADTFIYLELFNGQVRMTLSDGTMATLPRPFNTNSFRGLQLVRTAGSLDLVDLDFNDNYSVNFSRLLNIVAPVYVAGIDPSVDPTNISYLDATVQLHFVGCIDDFQIGDGNITTTILDVSNVLDNSTGVIFGACSGQCSTLNCNGGDCIEHYTSAECNCRSVFEGDGNDCTMQPRELTFNTSYYNCYTLPDYESPFSESEVVQLTLADYQSFTALMTGRQGNYSFSLHLDGGVVKYELREGSMTLVDLTADTTLSGNGQLVINRTESEITISYTTPGATSATMLGSAAITATALATVRFTDICVGGGFLQPISLYMGRLLKVYYNFYALFENEVEYRERRVFPFGRVKFVDSSATVTLPGNLAVATNVRVSFRTSQQNAILLHSEDSGNYFRVTVDNSQVRVTASANSTVSNAVCDLDINMYEWYIVVVEPVINAIDSASSINVRLDTVIPGVERSCDIQGGVATSLSSVPLFVGGSEAGVDGLVGCLEVEYNNAELNLETVLSDVIEAENCEPCFINPCTNGGMCFNLNDYEFNCSCVDPFFGRFCELMMTSTTPVMTSSSSVVPTTTIIISTSSSPSPSPSSSTPSPTPSSTSTQQETTTSVVPTSTTMSITNMTTMPVPTRTVSDDGGGDDSNLGAIIGIVLAIVVGLLLLLLVILVIIVVIRNRNNRQGFYQTYEGKGGDEMILKYSASLRSVTKPDTSTENGGTINRGGSVKKEQEYFI